MNKYRIVRGYDGFYNVEYNPGSRWSSYKRGYSFLWTARWAVAAAIRDDKYRQERNAYEPVVVWGPYP